MGGFHELYHWSPFQWSGPRGFLTCVEQIEKAKKEVDRPVFIKCPAGPRTTHIVFDTIDEAIAHVKGIEKEDAHVQGIEKEDQRRLLLASGEEGRKGTTPWRSRRVPTSIVRRHGRGQTKTILATRSGPGWVNKSRLGQSRQRR